MIIIFAAGDARDVVMIIIMIIVAGALCQCDRG